MVTAMYGMYAFKGLTCSRPDTARPLKHPAWAPHDENSTHVDVCKGQHTVTTETSLYIKTPAQRSQP